MMMIMICIHTQTYAVVHYRDGVYAKHAGNFQYNIANYVNICSLHSTTYRHMVCIVLYTEFVVERRCHRCCRIHVPHKHATQILHRIEYPTCNDIVYSPFDLILFADQAIYILSCANMCSCVCVCISACMYNRQFIFLLTTANHHFKRWMCFLLYAQINLHQLPLELDLNYVIIMYTYWCCNIMISMVQIWNINITTKRFAIICLFAVCTIFYMMVDDDD